MSGLSERATEQKCPEDEGQEIGNQGGAGSYHVGTPPLVPTSPLPLEPLTLTLLLFISHRNSYQQPRSFTFPR